MSRTIRSIRHWTNYQTERWTPEFQVRVQRNQEVVNNLHWPTVLGGYWGRDWDHDFDSGEKNRSWLKRLTSKMRRRRDRVRICLLYTSPSPRDRS